MCIPGTQAMLVAGAHVMEWKVIPVICEECQTVDAGFKVCGVWAVGDVQNSDGSDINCMSLEHLGLNIPI